MKQYIVPNSWSDRSLQKIPPDAIESASNIGVASLEGSCMII